MPFPLNVRLEALIQCQRHCCLCHQRKHTRIQCHHIVPEADGGPDTLDNCLPLCPDCHAEVMAFNPRHPIGGTPYHPEELRRRRDDWYAVVRQRSHGLAGSLHRVPTDRPHHSSMQGQVSFNYSDHDGFYRLGDGNAAFLTHWSKASNTSIHCYRDSTNLALALAPTGAQLRDITEASLLNYTSRVRTPQTGQFIVFENHCGRYAAARIDKVEDYTRGDAVDRLTLTYWILENGSDDFSIFP